MTDVMNRVSDLFRRSFTPAAIKFTGDGLGERQVRAVVSSASVDRAGDIVVQAGIDLTNFRKSPVVLFQHDADRPIARCLNIGPDAGGNTGALVQFPEPRTSATADEVYGLIKAGVIGMTSIGFIPLDMVPIDARKPWGGQRINRSELLEFSFVSIGANRDALITGKRLDGSLVKAGVCGRTRSQACGMTDPSECAVHSAPAGHCGRPTDATCGMKDPANCAVHGPSAAVPPPPANNPIVASVRRPTLTRAQRIAEAQALIAAARKFQ
jgi:HK97 family phage prohead protease